MKSFKHLKKKFNGNIENYDEAQILVIMNYFMKKYLINLFLKKKK